MAVRKQEIIVTEKALEPVIPVGTTVVCASGIAPEPGDFVVYFPGNGLPIFRRWRAFPDGTILLEALNKESDSYRAAEQELISRGKILVILSMNKTFRSLPEEEIAPAAEQSSSVDDFLTFQEAMAVLKVKRTRMYELLRSGEIKASKLGRLWRVERNSLNSFIRGCSK